MLKPILAVLSILTASASVEKAFQDFVQKYRKPYANADSDQLCATQLCKEKFGIFKANYQFIEKENTKGHTYELGINKFSDMTAAEFAKTHIGYKKSNKTWTGMLHLGTHMYTGETLPDSVDWVSQGVVTPVKDQGDCGSCWSFSSTGALEGAWKIATGKLVALSEQALVGCVDDGCQGGDMVDAFDYVKKHGLCSEDSLPYTAGNTGDDGGRGGRCQKHFKCTYAIPPGAVTGYRMVQKDDPQALMSAITKTPVSVVVAAGNDVFQNYNKGVMTGWCTNNHDHSILAVGYGTLGRTKYWKIKNSWGDDWGQNGYGLLAREKRWAKEDECGILSAELLYPVVSVKPSLTEITV